MEYDFRKIQVYFDNIKSKYPQIFYSLIDDIEEKRKIIEYYEKEISKLK